MGVAWCFERVPCSTLAKEMDVSDYQLRYSDTDTLVSATRLHGDFAIYLVDPSMNGTKLRSTTPEEFQAGQAWQGHAK